VKPKEVGNRMKAVKKAGSSGPRSRRRKVVGAALSLAAVVGIAGFVQASSAQAAELGTVHFPVSESGWNAGSGKAWDACKAQYSQTSSVELIRETGASSSEGDTQSYQTWACRDTP
jgi:hypothetical protein